MSAQMDDTRVHMVVRVSVARSLFRGPLPVVYPTMDFRHYTAEIILDPEASKDPRYANAAARGLAERVAYEMQKAEMEEL